MGSDWSELKSCKEKLNHPGPDDRAKVVAFHKLRWLCAAKMNLEAYDSCRWVFELAPKTYSEDGRQALLELSNVLLSKGTQPDWYADAIRAQRGWAMVWQRLEKEFNNGESVRDLFYEARAWLAFEIAEKGIGSEEIAQSMPYEYSDEAVAQLVGVGYYVEQVSR